MSSAPLLNDLKSAAMLFVLMAVIWDRLTALTSQLSSPRCILTLGPSLSYYCCLSRNHMPVSKSNLTRTHTITNTTHSEVCMLTHSLLENKSLQDSSRLLFVHHSADRGVSAWANILYTHTHVHARTHPCFAWRLAPCRYNPNTHTYHT